jgi:hypothetical protein
MIEWGKIRQPQFGYLIVWKTRGEKIRMKDYDEEED